MAAHHLRKLIHKSKEQMIPNMQEGKTFMSYCEWYTALETLAFDSYWSQTPAEERCTHILTPTENKKMKSLCQENNSCSSCDGKAVKNKSTRAKGNQIEGIKKSNVKKLIYTKKKKLARVANIKVEEVTISSSEASTESDQEDSSTEGSSDDDITMPTRYHYPKRSSCSDKREVITPPPFKMDGKMSLKDYLSTFESFFTSKFKGSSYDQTQKLAEFIGGDLLTVFNARGGRKLKYNDMKTQLLDYYRKQKVGSKSYWKKQLSEATPDLTEGYDIYGLRLVELAELAYPLDKKECASQLREHFLKTLPPIVSTKVRDTERSLKASTKGKYSHLTFSTIMEIAKEVQQQKSQPKNVMWATPGELPANQQQLSPSLGQSRVFRSRNQPYSPPRHYQQNPPKNRSHARQQEKFPDMSRLRGTDDALSGCSFCGNSNHVRRDCWRKNGSCLICGGQHFRRDCPNYDPAYQANSRSRNESTLN